MKTLLKLLTILTVVLAMNANAADNIAIVNVDTIVEQSKAAVSLKGQIEARKKDVKAKLQKKEAGLKAEKSALEKQQGVLSKDAFAKKAASFRDNIAAAQGDAKAQQTNLEKSFVEALKQIDNATVSVVEGIAKEKGYTMVLPKKTVLYYSGANDITPLVLKRLDEKLSSVVLK
jgi:outer membrane protein